MRQLFGFLEEVSIVLVAILRPAWKSVRENTGLAALSVVLAFGLWIFVTDAENPEQTKVVPDDIPVRPVNVPPEIWVPEEVATVRVEVRVEENAFDDLTKDDFEATVDLEGLTVGVHELPTTRHPTCERQSCRVEVRPLTTRGNLRVTDVLPDQIKVTLEALETKSVPAEVELIGSPPSEFSLGPTSSEVSRATVAGPHDNVQQVTRVVAPVDVEGRTESFESAVRLEARDQLGHLVERVTVEPALIDVNVEIEQVSFSRALAVSPVVVGTARQGYNPVGVTVDPPVVTVFGPEAYIDQAIAISTQPVDIEDATSDVVRTVSLDLPADVTVRGSGTASVTVKVTAASGQQVFAVPLAVTGLGDGLSIVGSLPPVQVFLFGPLPDLLHLNPNDISATIDLEGKDAGTHTVKVEVKAPEGLEVRSVSPEEIEITLEQR
jgi:YbbR domain-containing protein